MFSWLICDRLLLYEGDWFMMEVFCRKRWSLNSARAACRGLACGFTWSVVSVVSATMEW